MKKKRLLAIPVFFLFLVLSFSLPSLAQASCLGTVKVINYLGNPMAGMTITCTDCETPQSSCVSDNNGICPIDFGQTCSQECSYTLTSNNPNCIFQEGGYSVDCSDPAVPPYLNVICDPWSGVLPPDLPDPGAYSACTERSDEFRNSWPDECEGCSRTSQMSYTCSQTLEVHTSLDIQKNRCDYQCPKETGPFYTQEEWGGRITIDPRSDVPFAGKKKTETDAESWDIPEAEDEIRYLADYFEGTHEYYRDYYVKRGVTQHHGVNSLLSINYQGVFRKLAPYEYQNQVKKMMVERAVASKNGQLNTGKIHDYQLLYLERYCWQAPFILHLLELAADKIVNFPTGEAWKFLDYCLFNSSVSTDEHVWLEEVQIALEYIFNLGPIDFEGEETEKAKAFLSELAGHFPPDPRDFEESQEYQEAWDEWKKDEKWFNLWQVVPMASREDTSGKAYIHPQIRSPDQWFGPWMVDLDYPHLARLYETSHWLQQILLPKEVEKASDAYLLAVENGPETTADQPGVLGETNQGNCASSDQVLGEKILLAQVNNYDCSNPFSLSIEDVFYDGSQLYYGVRFFNNPPEGGRQCHLFVNGRWWGGCIEANGATYLQAGASEGLVNPVPASDNGTFYISASAQLERHTQCGVTIVVSTTCEVVIENGAITSANCGVGPPSPDPIPACGLGKMPNTGACFNIAIDDPNVNDKVCISPKHLEDLQSIDLKAFDEVENPFCDECNGVECPDPGNPCCKNFSAPVYRQVAFHPHIPYLEPIWDQTTEANQGFFNIFRPGEINDFDDLPAKGIISYSFDKGTAIPTQGDFYFPHLGGVQLAKDWLSTKALMPYFEN